MIGSLSVRILGIGLQFLVLILVSRALGPSAFGIYASGFATAAILAGLSCFGLPTMLVKELSASLNGAETSGLLRTHARAGVAAFAGLAFAACAVTFFVPSGRPSMLVALCVFPLLTYAQFRQSAALAFQSTTRAFMPEQIIIPVAVLTLIALTGGFSNRSLIAIVAATVSTSIAVSLFASVSLWRKAATPSPLQPIDQPLKAAFPFFLSQFPRLAFSNVDILIANYAFGSEAAGAYALASRMAGLVALPLFAVNAAGQPLFAKAFAESDKRQHTADLLVAANFFSMVGGLIVSAAILVFSLPFLAATSPENGIPFQLLALLTVAQLVNCAFGPNGMILLMSGHEKSAAIGTWMQLAILVAFAAGFAMSGTLSGIATGVVVAMVAGNLVMSWLVWLKTGILLHPFANWRRLQVGATILFR